MIEDELTSPKMETLEIQVTSETYKNLITFIDEKGWEEADGFRIILGAGLGYLQGEPFLDDGEEIGFSQDSKQLVARLMRAESLLASIRFRMFELQQVNRNWELSNGAIFKENIGLKNLANRHNEEIYHLRSTVNQLQTKLNDLNSKVDAKNPPDPEEAQRYPNTTLKDWLKRIRK